MAFLHAVGTGPQFCMTAPGPNPRLFLLPKGGRVPDQCWFAWELPICLQAGKATIFLVLLCLTARLCLRAANVVQSSSAVPAACVGQPQWGGCEGSSGAGQRAG